MCGIVGIVKFNSISSKDISNIKKLNVGLKHRGPDSSGIFFDKKICLGMRRLSIVGLENGNQPFFSKDKKLVLIANGEIYNYPELKKLFNKNKFTTLSDCEIILHLYEKYGIKLTKFLRGTFVFALYDMRIGKFFLFRDRMGEKPVYYYQSQNEFIFSSEIRNILKYPSISKEIDEKAVNQYFHFGYCVEPRTIFKKIVQLESGSTISIDIEKFKINHFKYWSLNENKIKKNIRLEDVFRKFKDAVNICTRCDTDIGVLLSGGLDSQLIWNSLKYKKNIFSLKYKDTKDNIHRNEDHNVALEVSKIDNANFYSSNLSNAEMIKDFKKMVISRDEPIADISGSSYYKIFKNAKSKKIPVLISGHGGDEFDGGYEWYRKSFLINEILRKKKSLKSFIKIWLLIIPNIYGWKKYYFQFINFFYILKALKIYNKKNKFFHITYENEHNFNIFSDNKNIFYNKIFFEKIKNHEPCKDIQENIGLKKNAKIFYINFIFKTYFAKHALMQGDKLSMSQGVELRLPFADYQFAEYFSQYVCKSKNFFNNKNNIFKLYKLSLKNKKSTNLEKKRGFLVPQVWNNLIFNKFKHLLQKNSRLVKLGIMNKKFKKFNRFSLKLVILEIWLRNVI